MREFWRAHPRAEGVAMLLVSLVCAVVAVGAYAEDRALDERGVRTTATVLSADKGRDVTYVVRYALPGGETVEAETGYAAGEYDPGDEIAVEYDPADPTNVSEVGARGGSWMIYGAFGTFVALAGGRGVFLMSQHHARKKRPDTQGYNPSDDPGAYNAGGYLDL